jgi:hypothetical protein
MMPPVRRLRYMLYSDGKAVAVQEGILNGGILYWIYCSREK